MKIGFDLDKVFIDYPPFIPGKLIDKLYKKKANGVLEYRIPSKPEQFLRLITHYSKFRPPIEKNIRQFKALAKNKNQYYLISSRFGFLKNKTEAIVKKYHIEEEFDGMYFNFSNDQPHLFKQEVIRKMGVERYIDDDLALLKFLSKENKNIQFFWLNKKSNRKLKSNLFAVTQISDILK